MSEQSTSFPPSPAETFMNVDFLDVSEGLPVSTPEQVASLMKELLIRYGQTRIAILGMTDGKVYAMAKPFKSAGEANHPSLLLTLQEIKGVSYTDEDIAFGTALESLATKDLPFSRPVLKLMLVNGEIRHVSLAPQSGQFGKPASEAQLKALFQRLPEDSFEIRMR